MDWVVKVFKNKTIMQELAKYLDIKSIFKLAIVSPKLYFVWKKDSNKYWDSIFDLSLKCAIECDWDILGESVFEQIQIKLNDKNLCNKCFRICRGRIPKLDCMQSGIHCKFIRTINTSHKIKLLRQKKFIYYQKFRKLVTNKYPSVTKPNITNLLNEEFRLRNPLYYWHVRSETPEMLLEKNELYFIKLNKK